MSSGSSVSRARQEPGLGGVEVHVHLQVDGQAAASSLAREPVQPPGEVDRIDRLDRLEQLDRPAGLVRLKRPDQMPASARHLGRLRFGLLDAVLAEQGQAGGDRVTQPGCRDGLGDRDQGDLRRIAAGSGAGVRNAGQHALARRPEIGDRGSTVGM
jgi:hypothetical protein